MSILFSEQIVKAICAELSKAEKSFTLISAYCKLPIVKYLDSMIHSKTLKKTLVVRMQPLDILKGSTDLDLYQYSLDNGWELRFNTDLHAKLYLFDDKRYVIGSANATTSGLSVGDSGNREMAVSGSADANDCQQIIALIQSSILITDSLYSSMKRYIDSLSKTVSPDPILQWPADVFSQLPQDFEPFYVEDFPPNSDPFMNRDDTANFLKIAPNSDKETIKAAFAESKCYRWMVSLLRENEDHYKQFGPLKKENLLGKFVNEENNSTVTQCLSNLQDWLKALDMPAIGVYRPNHTHIFYLREFVDPDGIDKQYEQRARNRTSNRRLN